MEEMRVVEMPEGIRFCLSLIPMVSYMVTGLFDGKQQNKRRKKTQRGASEATLQYKLLQ